MCVRVDGQEPRTVPDSGISAIRRGGSGAGTSGGRLVASVGACAGVNRCRRPRPELVPTQRLNVTHRAATVVVSTLPLATSRRRDADLAALHRGEWPTTRDVTAVYGVVCLTNMPARARSLDGSATADGGGGARRSRLWPTRSRCWTRFEFTRPSGSATAQAASSAPPPDGSSATSSSSQSNQAPNARRTSQLIG